MGKIPVKVILGVAPPLEAILPLPVTEVTVPPELASAIHAGFPAPSVFQTKLNCPEPEATTPELAEEFAATEIAGVAPPEEEIGKVPVTEVRVPVVGVVHVGAPAPAEVSTCPAVPIAVEAY